LDQFLLIIVDLVIGNVDLPRPSAFKEGFGNSYLWLLDVYLQSQILPQRVEQLREINSIDLEFKASAFNVSQSERIEVGVEGHIHFLYLLIHLPHYGMECLVLSLHLPVHKLLNCLHVGYA
jgi:hypothetical protein